MVKSRSSRALVWTNLRRIWLRVFFTLEKCEKIIIWSKKTQKCNILSKKSLRSYIPHTKVGKKQMFRYNLLKFNLKRFAQSAGPLSRVVVQLMICVGSCLLEFCTTLKHFVDMVPPLGCFLASILNPGSHFWRNLEPRGSFVDHFVIIFWCQKNTAAPKVLQERPKTASPVSKSRFDHNVGGHVELFFSCFA